jgi:hypothetical protein
MQHWLKQTAPFLIGLCAHMAEANVTAPKWQKYQPPTLNQAAATAQIEQLPITDDAAYQQAMYQYLALTQALATLHQQQATLSKALADQQQLAAQGHTVGDADTLNHALTSVRLDIDHKTAQLAEATAYLNDHRVTQSKPIRFSHDVQTSLLAIYQTRFEQLKLELGTTDEPYSINAKMQIFGDRIDAMYDTYGDGDTHEWSQRMQQLRDARSAYYHQTYEPIMQQYLQYLQHRNHLQNTLDQQP